jgi:hypothetical protein
MIRTCDPEFRKLVLYPTELRGQRNELIAQTAKGGVQSTCAQVGLESWFSFAFLEPVIVRISGRCFKHATDDEIAARY